MCIYSQLKNQKLYVTPRRVNSAPNVSKLCASGRIDISKYIEGGNMKLTALLDFIYMYAITNSYLCI